jgi:hypothetical protein
MEAVRTSETSVNFNVTTRRYKAEDSHLFSGHCRQQFRCVILPSTYICMLLNYTCFFTNADLSLLQVVDLHVVTNLSYYKLPLGECHVL